MKRRIRRAATAVVAIGLAAGVAACTSSPAEPSPTTTAPSPTSTPTSSGRLSLAIYGQPEETEVLVELARSFDRSRHDLAVSVSTYRTHAEAVRAYRAGPVPDVFMADRSDLPWLRSEGRTRRVDELLDERGVNFSATYARDSLQAFSADNGLECLPYAMSPLVVYINTDLVDFEAMAARGLDVPEEPDKWTWEQFEAAARFAARPRNNAWGLYVEPSLSQLSPFILSAGGEIFDDPSAPTTTVFSSDETQSALETVLPVLRDPRLMPTEEELEGKDPVRLFKQGRIGMMVGYRNLVPEMRQTAPLSFDVMPIPTISRTQTVGEVSGICMSSGTTDPDVAADLMISVFSDEAVGQVAHLGYLVPANVVVAQSDTFLQPGRQPANAAVFNTGVRSIVLPPLIDDFPEVSRAIEGDLADLLSVPVLELPELTAQIDADAQAVLSPETSSASPSGSTTP